MRDFKKFTSTAIRKEVEKHKPDMLDEISHDKHGGVFKVWMDRFDEVYLTKKSLLETKLDYIHNNPLQERWSLCKSPEEYNFSSTAFYELGKESLVKLTDYRELF